MDVFQAVKMRRSIRRFKPDPVPEALIREILEAARWSPSWGNTQPWEIMVVSGEPLERFKKANRQRLMEGAVSEPDTAMPGEWPAPQKRRYTEVGRNVLTAMEIARGDQEARLRYTGEMFALFDAPCLILLSVDRGLNRGYAMLDVGAIQQTICLLAHARGVGSCILAASVHYPAMIRETLPLPETKAVIIGVALGYPDGAAPVNNFSRERALPDELITWIR